MSQHVPQEAGRARLVRRALVLPLLGALAVAAGCGGADTTGEPDPAATPPPSASSVATEPATATPTADATVVIPKSAFLELPAELRKLPARTMPVADALPELCDDGFGTGGRSVTASAAMMSGYRQPGDPPSNVPYGTIAQTIFTFSGDGAADYLRRLRATLADCASFTIDNGDTVKVRSEALPDAGDEGLLVVQVRPARNLPGDLVEGETTTTQVAVVRVADAVTLLHDEGWEGTSGDPALVDDFVRAAVDALDTWQR
ncbi:hypothetical protein O3597_16530 [Verrucosispora sp. WMMA2044]|uniref:Sensor domain-containing protein n=1 Tax=Verrucosispora sioxanthis TaxID=2499994 RepID=A0A6M1KW11_9ACTN|nr:MULTISPECIES: hypothetical protein [Micromonospora]NEE62442.1 hypothetical protein [Verrucosispora sioxanthis]NGM11552.1 hypothetical protein [Verrucosispora sioxanthis]WBB46792.1 hypothetical protein O3597_16530 [Verrucosispora sp. WMMA2044]